MYCKVRYFVAFILFGGTAVAQTGPRTWGPADIIELQAQAEANIERFLDTIAGKSVFVGEGRFMGFDRQPAPVPMWTAMVEPVAGNGRWVACFYDHQDPKLSKISENTRVRIVGLVGPPVKSGLILGGNCIITPLK